MLKQVHCLKGQQLSPSSWSNIASFCRLPRKLLEATVAVAVAAMIGVKALRQK